MTNIAIKIKHARLDAVSYDSLRQHVLRRDGWRCQSCGSMSNLEVHHQQFRSQLGDDSAENLITLCADCHNALHMGQARSPNSPSV